MTMSEWAKHEAELACKRENPDYQHGVLDYGCACYESALKAYKSLCEDGHSGFSFGVTAGILKRLLDSYPLTPITEDEECWRNPFDYDEVTQQCQRMFSLFRDRQPDGSYKYHDVERVICCDADDESAPRWSNGFISSVIDDMFPITMPYYPTGRYYVYVREFLTDSNNGDFDTIEIVKIKKPDGEIIYPDLAYKEVERSDENPYGWEKIDKVELQERRNLAAHRFSKVEIACKHESPNRQTGDEKW